ncbi:transcription factor IIIA [Parasteatoda tepidariorum]|uniref:transcription factor IIIA n=1 Tax=Parasteatoda tepidariorum TaxID=114398 RepID=UPI0039BC6BB2
MNSAKYVCTYENCSATFHRSERYETHLRKHTGERPFICDFEGCDKTYARSSHLKRHQETHDKMFRCTLPGCSLILKTKATLMKHQDVFHPKKEARKFKCSECSEEFVKRSMLVRHKYTHSGVKEFKCSEPGCNKSFSMPSRLKSHVKSHVGYYCEESDCRKYFNRWSLLRKHKKECHLKTFRCHICEKVFKYACNLKAHCLTHVLEKDIFRCPVSKCIRAYQSQRSLSAHLKTFHETFTISCPEGNCPRFVKTQKELEIHIQHRHRRRLKKKETPKKPGFAEILSGFAKGTKKDLNPHLSKAVLEEEVRESDDEATEPKRVNRNDTQEQGDEHQLEASNTHLLNISSEEESEDLSGDEKLYIVNGECSNLNLNGHLSNAKKDKDSNFKESFSLSGITQNDDTDTRGSNLFTNTVLEEKVEELNDELVEIEVVYHSSQSDLDHQRPNGKNCRADQMGMFSDTPMTGKVT